MTDLQHANRCLVTKDYKKALRLFLRHAQECPAESAQAYAGAAECSLRSNVIDAPLTVAPGITLVAEGDHRGAEYYYRLALQRDPQNTKALWGLSQLLPELSTERRDLLERLVALQPGTLNLIALGDYYRSHVADYDRAYSCYKTAQEHAPRDQTAYLRLNDICRRMGRAAEGEEWSKKWEDAKGTKRRVSGNR